MKVYQKAEDKGKKGAPWYIRYEHAGRDYRVAGGRSKEQAKAKMVLIKAELLQGADPLSLTATRTFLELADAFLRDPDVMRLKWYNRVKTIVGRLVKHFGSAKMSRVTTDAISGYKTARLARDEKTGEAVIGDSTLNRELAVLRQMLRWGSRRGFLHRSRVPEIKFTDERPKIISLSQAEEDALLRACQSWLRNLLVIGIDTGCRLGEILGMTWRQVDMGAGTMTIHTEKKRNSVTRVLYMTARVRAIFDELPRGLPDEHVFQHLTGENTVTTVGGAVRRAVTRAKLSREITFHATRHTFATRQVESGTNILVLKEMLGHSSLAMVERYGHVRREDVRRAMLGSRSGNEGVRDGEGAGYETGYEVDPKVVRT